MQKNVFLLIINVGFVTGLFKLYPYDPSDPLVDPRSGKVNLLLACEEIVNNFFTPYWKDSSSLDLNSNQLRRDFKIYLKKNPLIRKPFNLMVHDLKQFTKKLPSRKLIRLARSFIQEYENGNLLRYITQGNLVDVAFRYGLRIGENALYKLWFYEHQITADLFYIFDNRFNITFLYDQTRTVMNIDMENHLYKEEVLFAQTHFSHNFSLRS